MEVQHFTTEADGFHGTYWPCGGGSGSAMIAMLGDDSDGHLAKCGARWINALGVNALTMSAGKKGYGYHNYPLERMGAAIRWLQAHGNGKVGIVGASTTGTLALVTASRFPDITLTLAFTPSDFVWQGFAQGKRDGCDEWPVEGESLFSWRGEPLPYLPFAYQHPEYWHLIQAEGKRHHDMINSRKVFADSEKAHPLTEDEMIRVEDIRGRLLMVAAEDDALWDAARYVRRMERRLSERPHECEVEALVYEHGTHFVFPQSVMTSMVPLVSGLAVRLCFSAARGHGRECKETRIDIDRHVRAAVEEWLRS